MKRPKAEVKSWRTGLFNWKQQASGERLCCIGTQDKCSAKIIRTGNVSYTWIIEYPSGQAEESPEEWGNETTAMLAADMWLYKRLNPTGYLAAIDKKISDLADQYNEELNGTLNTYRGDLLGQIARLRVERENIENNITT